MSRIANRPLTKPSEPHRFADLAQVLAAILLLIIPAFLYASQRAERHLTQRRIGALERELADLEERRQLLRIELASELDPRRLHEKAREIAGLREPDTDQIVYLARPPDVTAPSDLIAGVAGDPDGHP